MWLVALMWVCCCCRADDDNDAVLFEKIKSGNYDADDPIWENISDEAKDVVAKLLTVRTTHIRILGACAVHESCLYCLPYTVVAKLLTVRHSSNTVSTPGGNWASRTARTASTMYRTRLAVGPQLLASVQRAACPVPTTA